MGFLFLRERNAGICLERLWLNGGAQGADCKRRRPKNILKSRPSGGWLELIIVGMDEDIGARDHEVGR